MRKQAEASLTASSPLLFPSILWQVQGLCASCLPHSQSEPADILGDQCVCSERKEADTKAHTSSRFPLTEGEHQMTAIVRVGIHVLMLLADFRLSLAMGHA